MKFKTFVIGYSLALALLLFAQRQPQTSGSGDIRNVVDLTRPADAALMIEAAKAAPEMLASQARQPVSAALELSNTSIDAAVTRLEAPARLVRGSWTVDQIPPQRLVAPLALLNVRGKARIDPDYQVSVADIADWEKANGQIPMGSVVVARTGWVGIPAHTTGRTRGQKDHFPGFSLDAAQFLVQARGVMGLGIDTPSVDGGVSPTPAVHLYTMSKGLYALENMAQLERVPQAGALAIVAPEKLAGRTTAPVRIMALVR